MQWERPSSLFARIALTHQGWQRDVLVAIGADGLISGIQAGVAAPVGTEVCDLLLPGMANVHSHAFQRALAGLTETASGAGQDNFWSWRDAMHGFTQTLTPKRMEEIARDVYIGLLKQGYTSVGEFHYVHHEANGKPYAHSTELSDAVISAAQQAGIHLTHLPVLYQTGGFGGIAATDKQKRFINNTERYIELVNQLTNNCSGQSDITIGIAPHSLRAVPPESLQIILEAFPDCPVHIHIAEQEKEVQHSSCCSESQH